MKLFITIFLFSISYIGFAQPYASNNGRFTVDQIKACAPFTMKVTANDCDGSVGCAVLYGDVDANGKANGDNIVSKVITHPYTVPGHYKVQVIIGTDGSNFIDVDIVENFKPSVELYYCSGASVNLNIKDTHYDSYLVDFHDGLPPLTKPNGSPRFNYTFNNTTTPPAKTIDVRGVNNNAANNCLINTDTLNFRSITKPIISQLEVANPSTIDLDFKTQNHVLYKLEIATNTNTIFQQLQDVYAVDTAQVNNVKADNSYYCVRLQTNNPCTNSNNPALVGNIICSANFKASASNNQNNLSWQTEPTGIIDYTINRPPGSPISKPASPLSYTDTDIICNTTYAYQLISNYGNGIKAISHVDSVKAISTDIPSAIDNISSLVNQTEASGVDLVWLPGLQPKEYSIFKSTFYNLLGKSKTENYTDAAYTTVSNSCYKISYVSFCGNTSPLSVETCPIQLTGTLQKDNTIVLTWSPYNGYKNGVSGYVVEKYSSQGQLLQTFAPTTATTLTDNSQDVSTQSYSYVVKATANDAGVVTSVSNTIIVTKEPNLYYPTAFTPNQDGLNDKFVVYGQFVNHFELQIFNRWGELLFATDDMNEGWDGTYKGNTMPEGTYAFIAKLTDLTGKTFTRSGSVMLLHKK